jgi:hypothetical protein
MASTSAGVVAMLMAALSAVRPRRAPSGTSVGALSDESTLSPARLQRFSARGRQPAAPEPRPLLRHRLCEVSLDGLCCWMFDAGELTPVSGPANQAGPSRGNEDGSDEDGQ